MASSNPSFKAAGSIYPRRFVTQAGQDPHEIIQVSATTQFIAGIMQEGQRRAPGAGFTNGDYAAIDGDTNFEVYGPLEQCWVDVGGTAVSNGDLLKSDTDGKAEPIGALTSGTQYVGARALTDCASGGICRVQVWLQVLPDAAS